VTFGHSKYWHLVLVGDVSLALYCRKRVHLQAGPLRYDISVFRRPNISGYGVAQLVEKLSEGRGFDFRLGL
jgi:hypothetical protein